MDHEDIMRKRKSPSGERGVCRGAGTSRRILIIDDDQAMSEEILALLCDEGCDVSLAHDGLEGLELLFRHHYDIVLLDLELPGLSGFDILKKLQGRREGMQVIVLTGNQVASKLVSGEPSWDDVEEEQYQTIRLADGVLTKPFDMAALLSLLAVKEGKVGAAVPDHGRRRGVEKGP